MYVIRVIPSGINMPNYYFFTWGFSMPLFTQNKQYAKKYRFKWWAEWVMHTHGFISGVESQFYAGAVEVERI